MENKDSDLLWVFSGLSGDYILKVCCVQSVEHVLRLKFSGITDSLKQDMQNNSGGICRCDYYRDSADFNEVFSELRQKSVREFYSLLALDNLTYREQLRGDIFDYLNECNMDTINPWGYFDFRLPGYQYLIERAVNNIVNQYLEKQDYDRCLKMIGEIAAHALHKIKILHVIFLFGGGFLLLNDQYEVLEASELKEELDTAVSLGLKLDDVLAAAFIYYAPEKITVHNYQSAETRVSPMIWDMAGVPVDFCNGCEICHKYIMPVFAEV
ncbi:MAG: sporulation protein YtxC [Bacillota bacterium]